MSARPRRYPWADWFDGQVHVLERGRDFTAEASSFQDRVHAAAQERAVRVSTRRLGDVVLIQVRVASQMSSESLP